MDERDIKSIVRACTHFLGSHYPQTIQHALSELAASVDPNVGEAADRYGQGTLINNFEKEVAELLGKEAAVFMPSGTMCQQIALRIWSERANIARVAFHPTCHLELHEQRGYRLLHNLDAVLLGSPDRLFTLEDLQDIAEPISTLLIELPQREIGGQLPTWEKLTEIIEWARSRNIHTHLDGARLWECQPFYGREYAEIAALFDTVYVSFYKILGGITGSILAGPQDVIAEARIWQRRHGGNLFHLYPYFLSAQKGLHERLPRIAIYYKKAIEVAEALHALPEIEIMPYPPQTNMMHVFLRGDREKLLSAHLDIAEETKTWLFGYLLPTAVPGYNKFELTIGDAALDLPTADIAHLFQELFKRVAS